MERGQTELECLDKLYYVMCQWLDNNFWRTPYYEQVLNTVCYLRFIKLEERDGKNPD